MDVGDRERESQQVAWEVVAVREVREAKATRELLHLTSARAVAHEEEEDTRIVAKDAHGFEDRAEIVDDTGIARVHDDEAVLELEATPERIRAVRRR